MPNPKHDFSQDSWSRDHSDNQASHYGGDHYGSDSYNADGGGTGILSSTLRNVGILVVACMAGLFFLDFSGEPQAGTNAAQQQPAQAANVQSAGYGGAASEMRLRANAYGSFLVKGEINGTEILFLVDTGASKVSLAPQDAERIGFRPHQLDFTERFHSANGIIRGAPVTLPRLRIGQIEMYDVEASVQETPMQVSLLGMTFLSRLESYEVQGDRMTLAW